MSPHARSHLAVLFAFILATLVVTFPLAFRPNDGIPFGGDGFQFIWNGWWMEKALADPKLSIWYTKYQYAPHGTSLGLHDLSILNALAQAELRDRIGDFATYNLLVIIHYILGAWGAYVLAWYFTGNRAASVTAGFIYGFSTTHAMHLSQLSTVSSGWLPLSVYYMIKYARNGGVRDGILSVLTLAAAALSTWYHFVFSILVVFGFLCFGQIFLHEQIGGIKRFFRTCGIILITTIGLSPALYQALKESGQQPVQWLIDIGKQYFIDPAWLILPSPHHPVFGQLTKPLANTIPGNLTEGVASLGIATLVLWILSWFRKELTTRTWCWMGTVFLLLSLGTELTIFGVKTGIPGLFNLWSSLPILNLVRIPARFAIPLTLAIAISASGYIAGLGDSWHKGLKRFFLLWILPIIILFETLIIPIHQSGPELNHPMLSQLQQYYRATVTGAIAPDLLVNFPVLPERRQFLYQQTIHQIPTVDGALSNPPPGAIDFFMHFNWNVEYLRAIGVDIVLYQPWAAKTSLGEYFELPDESNIPSEYRGKKVTPLEFFRDVMKYLIIYQDDQLIVFVP